MDRSWMNSTNRFKDPDFSNGVKEFMALAHKCVNEANRVRCPCRKCNNRYYKSINVVEDYLWIKGFDQDYTQWIFHGEKEIANCSNVRARDDRFEVVEEDDGLEQMLDNVFMGTYASANDDVPPSIHIDRESTCLPNSFQNLWDDAQQPLFPSSTNFSKLSFIVKLLHIKTVNNWSIKSFDMLIDLLHKAFDELGVQLPRTHYEAKQLRRGLGFSYEKIDACKNDCVLYWKDHSKLDYCPTCGEPRWTSEGEKKKLIPQKVLRHFPLKPRLQRLFMCSSSAKDMRWHVEGRCADPTKMRHPADSVVWKEFDYEYPWFAREIRNVRLGLASDGFNPFGNMSTSYSVWPVILTPYNLPPWKCMKDPYFMMSLLIPGPRAPGNDIDVYLQPLIDELQELWVEGILTYDAYKNETFKLHASLIWTINDFPAYGNLSGWSTKGKMACPSCNGDTGSLWLKHSKKCCFMDHRRFLPSGHYWRKKKSAFNGKIELRGPPVALSGADVLEQMKKIRDVKFGKSPLHKKGKRNPEELNWCKKSIFFNLPYWSSLKLRHNLDVMHIEKNICESVLGTLMGIDGKNKDTIKSRIDLEQMGIKSDLHILRRDGHALMPAACYTLSKSEKLAFCRWLKSVKFPDGFASNVGRCVNLSDCKISGMKSHDCHVFLQRLLPVGIRGFLKGDISKALTDLSSFFRAICSKTLVIEDLTRLQEEIVITLCRLEMIFPPSFFDVMVHLAIHLPEEALLAGPVQCRWMYPTERFLGKLKRFVRNRSRPEGSIAEAYIDFECQTFCSMYLDDIETKFNHVERNNNTVIPVNVNYLSVFTHPVRTLGAATHRLMDDDLFAKAQWYILNNCSELQDYLSEHYEKVINESPLDVDTRHESGFPLWFKDHIKRMRSRNVSDVNQQMYALACGPDQRVSEYAGCIMNGIRFRTYRSEQRHRTQNSGVVVEGWHDSNLCDFYGQIIDILEFHYMGGNKVYLFKCNWWDTGDKKRGVRVEGQTTSVNTARHWYKGDPFILATQAHQVFYIDDPKYASDWKVVQKIVPRNEFDGPLLTSVQLEVDRVADAYQEDQIEPSTTQSQAERV